VPIRIARRRGCAPQRQALRRTCLFEQARGLPHLRGRGHLRQHHAVGAGDGERTQIIDTPGRVERIGAHQQFARAVTAGRDRRQDLFARFALAPGIDRILEVQDQRIGCQRARVVEGARVGARHVERGAAGSNRHGRVLCWNSCVEAMRDL